MATSKNILNWCYNKNNNNNNNNNNNFINYPGKRPVSQSTKVDRLVLIGDQQTKKI